MERWFSSYIIWTSFFFPFLSLELVGPTNLLHFNLNLVKLDSLSDNFSCQVTAFFNIYMHVLGFKIKKQEEKWNKGVVS